MHSWKSKGLVCSYKVPEIIQPKLTKVNFKVAIPKKEEFFRIKSSKGKRNEPQKYISQHISKYDNLFIKGQEWDKNTKPCSIKINQFISEFEVKLKQAESEELTNITKFINKAERVSQKLEYGVPHKQAFIKMKDAEKKKQSYDAVFQKIKSFHQDQNPKTQRTKSKIAMIKKQNNVI